MRTLVLNAGYEPLSVVSFRRAIVLVLTNKATILADDGEDVVHSPSCDVPRPSVILLRRYVKMPRSKVMPLSRRSVLRRDRHRCAYCTKTATTIDHVVPRSRGGADTWENLVACCLKCNNSKGARTPGEMGWKLHVTPSAPPIGSWFVRGIDRSVPAWEEYLAFARAA